MKAISQWVYLEVQSPVEKSLDNQLFQVRVRNAVTEEF